MLPTGETRKECWIVEEIPAWEECERCEGIGDLIGTSPFHTGEQPCRECHGAGGKWHDAVVGINNKYNCWAVTKSSRLIRRWRVCIMCDGDGWLRGSNKPCEYCQLGAEPDSQGPWEVK